MYDLLQAQRFAVLFAKQWLGKTSLIQAALMPRLVNEGYDPIYLRFQSGTTPTNALLNAVKQHVKQRGIEAKVADSLRRIAGDSQPGIWNYLKAYSLEQTGRVVLLFDQFEAFFDSPADQQQAFIEQLSDMLLDRVPADVPAELASLLDCKVLFALRSDYLDRLDDLSRSIPSILDHRYQLHAFDKAQAREAITAPAALTGDFASPTFTYPNALLEALLQTLSNERGEIEPERLQIICAHIEQEVLRRKPAAPVSISAAYLEAHGKIAEGVRAILEKEMPDPNPPVKRGILPFPQRMSTLFIVSVLVMALHKVECWWTDEWIVSPFFQWFVSIGMRPGMDPNDAIGELVFSVFVFWLFAGLFMGWMLMRGGMASMVALSVWGLTFLLEWHHVYRVFSLESYYPGIITAAVYLPLMFMYWRELVPLIWKTVRGK